MADESSAYPGESRVPGHWMDGDTAERLLGGESLEALPRTGLDERAAAEAGVLAKALHSLAGETGPSPAELPGEAAALAAFRQTRGSGGRRAAGGGRPDDGGAVRLGASRVQEIRWARPVRFGVAAALAGCMIGGVAVAAGAGVLPSPFGGDHRPDPSVTVSEAATPDRPLLSPSPSTSGPGHRSEPPSAEASPKTPDGSPAGKKTGDDVSGPKAGNGPRWGSNKAENWWPRVVEACRDYHGGKHLDGDRKRRLDEAARGAERVERFCDGVLSHESGGEDSHHYGDVTGGQDSDDDGSTSGNPSGEPSSPAPSEGQDAPSVNNGNTLHGDGGGASPAPSSSGEPEDSGSPAAAETAASGDQG